MEPSITPVIIVSGFLGAGKTTLINQLLKEALSPAETVLIENEFGEVPIDDQILSSSGIKMKTLASGCICCTLSGSFIAEIPEIVSTYHPKAIIIEPTGMASPSDLLDICNNASKAAPIKVASLISVINAQNIERVLKLDIPAFSRQFECVSFVVLTHAEDMPADELESVKKRICEKVGADVPILAVSLDEIDALELLAQAELAFEESGYSDMTYAAAEHEEVHEHAHECDHDHDHGDFGGIETKTFYPARTFTDAELNELLSRIDKGEFGTIVRAKGFLESEEQGMQLVEQVLGSSSLIPTNYQGPQKLVIIGRNIAEPALSTALGL